MLSLKVLDFMCSKGLHEIFSIEQRMEIAQKLWRYDNSSQSAADVMLTDADEENRRLRSTICLLAQFLNLRGHAKGAISADCNGRSNGSLTASRKHSTPSPSDSSATPQFAGLLDDILFGLSGTDGVSSADPATSCVTADRRGSPNSRQVSGETLETADREERQRDGSPALSLSAKEAMDGAPLHVPTLGANDVEEVLLDASFGTEKLAASLDATFAPLPYAVVENIRHQPFCTSQGELLEQRNAKADSSGEIETITTSSPQPTMDAESGKEEEKDDRKDGQPITLWEFLLECLHFDCYEHIVRWKNKKEGTFKIVESQTLAGMWGMVKRKPDMNFDKMSRAMRYYYSKGILQKTATASRLEYTFGEKTPWRTFTPNKNSAPGRFFFHPQLPGNACAMNFLPGPLKAYQRLMRCSKSFKSARFLPYLVPSFAEVA